jgi:RNA polymerase sigma factor (sigma-70 family)
VAEPSRTGSDVGRSLEELAQAAVAGDDRARDELLRRIQPDVMRICARVLPFRMDAEEACQDALMRISTNLHRFEGRAKFTTWMYTIASNSGRQTYRTLKRRFRESTSDTQVDRADPRTTSVIAGSRLDLLDALEELEEYNPEIAAPFVLRDLGELSYDEIAKQLSIPVGTAKSRVHDARVRLRRRLTR